VEIRYLVRSQTDEQVLRALMRHRRLTRAELAAEVGISKPTAGESVRRLTERGLLADTGERTPGGRGMGRVGQYYALAGDIGTALAVSIAPAGIVAECVDAYGETIRRAKRSIDRPVREPAVAAALREVIAEVSALHSRLAVVSAADPVDRASGRLVQLPDSPFLVGSLDPVEILSRYVDGPVTVDNDVNWAARAEPGPGDFAYLFLGEGLGCAIVGDGEVRRGHTGLAGEIAHVVTAGPDGRAAQFIDVFGELGLRRPSSSAIDVDRLLAAGAAGRDAIGRAVAGVVAAVVALADPHEIVIGGAWGPALLPEITAAVSATPRPVPLRPAALTGEPPLIGARHDAVDRLRALITESA
jgi:predicted NBD/HSP70 family sugar kinase